MRKLGLFPVGPSVGWAVLLVAGLVECGGNDLSRSTGGQGSSGAPAGGSETVAGGGLSASGGSLGVAGTASGACVAPSAVGYQPMWTPPSNPEAGACTEQQVSQEYSLCEPDSGAYDQTGCCAFNVDPANSSECSEHTTQAGDGRACEPRRSPALPQQHREDGARAGGCFTEHSGSATARGKTSEKVEEHKSKKPRFCRGFSSVARGRNAGCIPRYHWGLNGDS
jgi:hypothetical protein